MVPDKAIHQTQNGATRDMFTGRVDSYGGLLPFVSFRPGDWTTAPRLTLPGHLTSNKQSNTKQCTSSRIEAGFPVDQTCLEVKKGRRNVTVQLYLKVEVGMESFFERLSLSLTELVDPDDILPS